jgi:hypothetical protein
MRLTTMTITIMGNLRIPLYILKKVRYFYVFN